MLAGRKDEITNADMQVESKWIFCNSLAAVLIVHLTLMNEAGGFTRDTEPCSVAAES